ncbi:hypothetical protein D3C86_1669690 [compost metagenome]
MAISVAAGASRGASASNGAAGAMAEGGTGKRCSRSAIARAAALNEVMVELGAAAPPGATDGAPCAASRANETCAAAAC